MLETFRDMLHRFDNFSDSVIEEVSLDYSGGPYPHIRLILNCQDDHDPGRHRKRCVFDFSEVGEFKLTQPMNRTLQIMSFGVGTAFGNGLTYLDFDCNGFAERALEEVRAGDFYIGAKSINIAIV